MKRVVIESYALNQIKIQELTQESQTAAYVLNR